MTHAESAKQSWMFLSIYLLPSTQLSLITPKWAFGFFNHLAVPLLSWDEKFNHLLLNGSSSDG
jgi:hypothetical protein